MDWSPLAFLELFIVLAFVAGWLVIERVCRHYDRQRLQRDPEKVDRRGGSPPARQ